MDTDSAQAKLINDLTSRTGANEASVTALSQTLTDNSSATAQQIGALQSATGDNTSAITSLSKTVTDNQSATANDIKLLNTAVGDNKAAVQQVSSAQATLDGKVSATWSVKVETSKKGKAALPDWHWG